MPKSDVTQESNVSNVSMTTVQNNPKSDIIILAGDLNANLGSDNDNKETVMGVHAQMKMVSLLFFRLLLIEQSCHW